MPRLIDADRLKQVIADNVYLVQDAFNSRDYGMFWTGGIEKAIDETPTVEAEPVRHGHWEIDMRGNWACSLCGNDPYHDNMKNMNYCPNCGAKMDGEKRKDETN